MFRMKFKDRKMALAAVQQNGMHLRFASKAQKADREVVLAAVKNKYRALEFAAKPLKADREVMLAALHNKGGHTETPLQWGTEVLKADRQVVLEAVQHHGEALGYAAESLKADREVVLAAVQDNWFGCCAFKYAAESLKADREVVLAAVQQNDKALLYAAESLKADREVVLAAVQQNGEALEFAARNLRDDAGFVLAASRLNSEAHAYAAEILGADALSELEAAAAVLYRLKIVLLGHGGAGKTCLRRRLAKGTFVEQLPATDGVEMSVLELATTDEAGSAQRKLSVFLWDLGGQDEYLATHPFFIDESAFFGLVVDLALFERSNHANVAASLRFLRTVRARAHRAPIALIGTHADRVNEPAQLIEQLRVQLEAACPPAIAPDLVFVLSSCSGDGVDALRIGLANHAFTLDHVRETVPAPYIKLHEQLSIRAANARHLPLEDVVAIATGNACRVPVTGAPDATIPDQASTLRALAKLSGWGAIHHRDSPELRGTVVLQPQWLADAMACIIGPKNAATAAADAVVRVRTERRHQLMAIGRLDHASIDQLWSAETIAGFDESNVALCPYLLATMHAFELAYPLRDETGEPTGVSLVPSMLPIQRPVSAAPFEGLADDSRLAKMRVELSFLPQELFPRLLVRLQQYVQAGDCWFDAHALSSGGMMLMRGDGAEANRAVVSLGGHFNASGVWITNAAFATSIIIDARGPNPTMLRGLAWRCLETLHSDYEGVEATVSLLASAGGGVDLEDAQADIRDGRPVRSRGELLLVDDLKPGALVTGARYKDEERFDAELASAPPEPGDWRARAIALFERTYLGPDAMRGHDAPPLLWLLVSISAQGRACSVSLVPPKISPSHACLHRWSACRCQPTLPSPTARGWSTSAGRMRHLSSLRSRNPPTRR